ncbi:MAG: SH3 domain-containing protein [Anaerolineales bacterium]|nr:SH3 domain-containing protein [Anaerolineales bacterium]
MLRRALQTGLILIFLTACNSATPPPPTSTLTLAPTATQPPTPTVTPLPTATPLILNLKILQPVVNCRSGPGVVFELINELKEGQVVRAVGRDVNSDWWYIQDPGRPNGFCWVAASVSQAEGETSRLPIRQAPGTRLLSLTLSVEPQYMEVNCYQFPQTFFFKAEVAADGPLIAQWQWEARDDGIIETGSLAFEQAGTKILNQYFQVNAAGDYWVQLNFLSPTPLNERINFQVRCS